MGTQGQDALGDCTRHRNVGCLWSKGHEGGCRETQSLVKLMPQGLKSGCLSISEQELGGWLPSARQVSFLTQEQGALLLGPCAAGRKSRENAREWKCEGRTWVRCTDEGGFGAPWSSFLMIYGKTSGTRRCELKAGNTPMHGIPSMVILLLSPEVASSVR